MENFKGIKIRALVCFVIGPAMSIIALYHFFVTGYRPIYIFWVGFGLALLFLGLKKGSKKI